MLSQDRGRPVDRGEDTASFALRQPLDLGVKQRRLSHRLAGIWLDVRKRWGKWCLDMHLRGLLILLVLLLLRLRWRGLLILRLLLLLVLVILLLPLLLILLLLLVMVRQRRALHWMMLGRGRHVDHRLGRKLGRSRLRR